MLNIKKNNNDDFREKMAIIKLLNSNMRPLKLKRLIDHHLLDRWSNKNEFWQHNFGFGEFGMSFLNIVWQTIDHLIKIKCQITWQNQ